MELVDAVPQGIRRGQTLQIRLALSDETQALLLPKGGFYQATELDVNTVRSFPILCNFKNPVAASRLVETSLR